MITRFIKAVINTDTGAIEQLTLRSFPFEEHQKIAGIDGPYVVKLFCIDCEENIRAKEVRELLEDNAPNNSNSMPYKVDSKNPVNASKIGNTVDNYDDVVAEFNRRRSRNPMVNDRRVFR